RSAMRLGCFRCASRIQARLEDVVMQVGVFMEPEGKVITDSERQVVFPDHVGREVQRVNQPAVEAELQRNSTSRHMDILWSVAPISVRPIKRDTPPNRSNTVVSRRQESIASAPPRTPTDRNSVSNAASPTPKPPGLRGNAFASSPKGVSSAVCQLMDAAPLASRII